MIIVPLKGRTGNNLFQYAAGRALALRNNTTLVLDSSWGRQSRQKITSYLKDLPLKAVYKDKGFRFKSRLRHLGLQSRHLHFGRFHRDKGLVFDPEFGNLPDGTMLWGFYQCYRYFAHIESELRNEINLSGMTLPEESSDLESRIRNEGMASLHVRRGDYLHVKATQCLSADYYQRAMAHLRDRIPNIRFCVFSDDPEWCRKEFAGERYVICDLPGSSQTPLHDLRLMSACSHHIIANSSYSWWGAWLNPAPSKIVVSPKMWMNNCPSDPVVPEEWILIR